MLLASGAGAQTDPPSWQRYALKDEQFSVALPALPTVEYRRVPLDSHSERLEITLGAFADGVVYLIQVVENRSRQSLDSFMKDRANTGVRPWNRKTESKLKLDGGTGKGFSLHGIEGAVQFFSIGNRLFNFTAIGAPPDDARVTQFFSSISLLNKNDSIEVAETRLPPLPPDGAPSPGTVTSEQVFTPKEVDKSFRPVMMAHPEYTEAARQSQIRGTVVLECVLTDKGHIGNIRVVEGLSHGLTERAVAAARRLKFIPAMKDGKYVSVSTRLVYNFNLF